MLDEQQRLEAQENKNIRGYIMRSLAKGHRNSLLIKQITNSLMADGLIINPDIGKHIDYLKEADYIAFTDRTVTAYTAYQRDAVIKLTRKGVDLLEGTVEDQGVDI